MQKKWTEEEEEILRVLYETNTTYEVSIKMNRSSSSIRNKLRQLGIKCGMKCRKKHFEHRRYWTDEEVEQLHILYKCNTIEDLAKVFQRTPGAINSMLQKMEITRKEREPNWTSDEISILFENRNLSLKELHKLFPHRSIHSIRDRKSRVKASKTLFKGKYKFKGRHMREHEVIMSEHMGRKLTTDEHVHHIDGNTRNNDITNLYILSNSTYQKLHGDLNKLLNNILSHLMVLNIITFKDGEYTSIYSDDRLMNIL